MSLWEFLHEIRCEQTKWLKFSQGEASTNQVGRLLVESFSCVFNARLSEIMTIGSLWANTDLVLLCCNYLHKILPSQGLSTAQLDQVSQVIIVSRLRYALSVWSGFLSADLINRIQAMLKGFSNLVIVPFTISLHPAPRIFLIMPTYQITVSMNCYPPMFID